MGNTLSLAVTEVLEEAGIPEARFDEDDEGMLVCEQAGYHLSHSGAKYAVVAILGGGHVEDDGARSGERDELMQKVRAALDSVGFEVRVNDYGHVTAVKRD
jgi:hypothetical protein